jgi:hypothetical protein
MAMLVTVRSLDGSYITRAELIDILGDDEAEYQEALIALGPKGVGRYWIGGGGAPLVCLYTHN